MTKFGPEPAQTTSHLSHFTARHVFGEMPQRADTSRVRGIYARVRPLLLFCSPRALPTPGCRSGHTRPRLPRPSPPPGSLSPPPAPPERSHHGCRRPLLPSCRSYCAALCCCIDRKDMARAWPCLPMQQPSARPESSFSHLRFGLCSVIERRKDLGLE